MISEALRRISGDVIEYPDGVYISVSMTKESTDSLYKYMTKHLPGIEPVDGFHCTIIFSKKPMSANITSKNYTTEATFKNFSLFGEDNDALVAEIYSPYLNQRNKVLTDKYSFISDFPNYKAHFSLSYEAQGIDVNSLPDIDFPIVFENETVELLDTDYA